ncbi:MAG TPA: hypothetical protein VGR90_06550, partial [Acidimicrobiales bacterium]|nr:hypothetical protein [Acidimicrobiales bacterium]
MTVSSFRDDDIRALMAQASSAGPAADSEPTPADSELEDTEMPAEPPRPQFFAPANANVYSELADLPPAPVPGPSAPGGVEAASPEKAPEAPTVQTPAVQVPTVQIPTVQVPTVQMPTVRAPASEAP